MHRLPDGVGDLPGGEAYAEARAITVQRLLPISGPPEMLKERHVSALFPALKLGQRVLR